jgi:ubiquinone/menaquinone biosynthesis C-methylase UbiE
MTQTPRIIDYEGSNYRTDFWEGQGRAYEDRVERAVLQRWLPASGRRLLELGAGFGRITNEYQMFDQVVLLDYSFSQLVYAREQYGDDGFIYVAADAYKLPFREGVFDAATMIRVLHHFADVPLFMQGLRRVLAPEAAFILEFASKRNLKAMLRYALGRQAWRPYDHDPVEFVELNFDFHPEYIAQTLKQTGFNTHKRIPVSYFRLGLLKRLLPASVLAGLDRIAQMTGALYSPSVFTHNMTDANGTDNTAIDAEKLFICPQTGGDLVREGDALVNHAHGTRYEIRDGVYVFKALD